MTFSKLDNFLFSSGFTYVGLSLIDEFKDDDKKYSINKKIKISTILGIVGAIDGAMFNIVNYICKEDDRNIVKKS